MINKKLPLRTELVIVLVVKLVFIFLLGWFFFSDPLTHQQVEQGIESRLSG